MYNNMINCVREATGGLLNLVYPDSLYCICCGKIIDDTRTYHLCNDCMGGIKWATGRTCKNCGKVLSGHNPGDYCYNCREHGHSYRRGYTCTEYGSHERAMIFGLKYNDRTDIARIIGQIMYDRLILLNTNVSCDADGCIVEPDVLLRSRYDYIIPIPMYREKQKARGYNQAGLIACELARLSGIEYEPDILLRAIETKALRGLSPAERRQEMQGVWAINIRTKDALKGANILLVDDIYTTGATIDTAAEMLKKGGAREVDFISFASGADVVK